MFYYMIDLVEKGMKYFTANKDYKEPVKNILNKLSNDNSFIDRVTNMIDTKRGIDSTMADGIVKLPIVQNLISKNIGDLDKTEMENQIKRECNDARVKEPNVFTEFGTYTVGESAALLLEICAQKQQNEDLAGLASGLLMASRSGIKRTDLGHNPRSGRSGLDKLKYHRARIWSGLKALGLDVSLGLT